MQTVFKYVIPAEDSPTLMIPDGARILSIQGQAGEVCLWAHVDTEMPMAPVKLHVFGTGHHMPDKVVEWQFLGTTQLLNGTLVFHVYREI